MVGVQPTQAARNAQHIKMPSKLMCWACTPCPPPSKLLGSFLGTSRYHPRKSWGRLRDDPVSCPSNGTPNQGTAQEAERRCCLNRARLCCASIWPGSRDSTSHSADSAARGSFPSCSSAWLRITRGQSAWGAVWPATEADRAPAKGGPVTPAGGRERPIPGQIVQGPPRDHLQAEGHVK